MNGCAAVASRLAALASLAAALAACTPAADGEAPPQPDVIYAPTPPEAVTGIMEMAAVGPDDVVYDLGSGDGRLVIAAAERGATGTGVEIDPELIEVSRANAQAAGVAERTKFVQADLFAFDFSDASVVTLYLSDRLNVQLRPRLLEELAPGTRVVSYIFAMGDWPPDETARFAGNEVSMWVIPADAAGTWRWRDGSDGSARTYRLTLEQTYQQVSGTLAAGGTEVPIEDARLAGDRLAFTVPPAPGVAAAALRFEGRIRGDTIEGTVAGPGAPQPWAAERISQSD